ncbi:MAG: hypothetical protein L6408_02550 [Nanoarchaeota archaeon]|nr:hypothetical protein [Nanoarchaeota archaeon]
MIDKRGKIIEICDRELRKILEGFLKDPLIYFSEKDLHWLICKHIEECLEREQVVPYGGLVETGNKPDTEDEPYKSILVHQEYGRVDKQKYRQDIVILDPEEVKETDNFKLMKKDKNYLTPVVSIEIITEQERNWKSKGLAEKLSKDFESLEKSEADKGYLLIFYRVTNKRGLKQHEKTYIKPLKEWIEANHSSNLKIDILCGIKYLKENRSKRFVNGRWEEII